MIRNQICTNLFVIFILYTARLVSVYITEYCTFTLKSKGCQIDSLIVTKTLNAVSITTINIFIYRQSNTHAALPFFSFLTLSTKIDYRAKEIMLKNGVILEHSSHTLKIPWKQFRLAPFLSLWWKTSMHYWCKIRLFDVHCYDTDTKMNAHFFCTKNN